MIVSLNGPLEKEVLRNNVLCIKQNKKAIVISFLIIEEIYVTVSFLLVEISERKSKELVQGISDC